jgi:hypothetical protein
MEQQEKEFIYKRLHFMTEQMNHLEQSLDGTLAVMGKLVSAVEQLAGKVEKMDSHEYAFAQAKKAEAVEIAGKIKMFRDIINQHKKE